MVSTNTVTLLQNVDSSLVNVYVGLLLMIVLLSLVLNILVLTTLYTQHSNRRNSMDFFIANMAVSDILSSFSATFTINNAKLHWNSNSVICKIAYYLLFVSYAVTMLTLCTTALDRFYGICLPIKHRQVYLFKKRTISICLIWILPCLLFSPYVYAYKVQDFRVHQLSGKVITLQICNQTWDPNIEQIYFTLVVFFLLYLSPLALFGYVFVKVLQKLQEPRSTSSGGNVILHKKRMRMTVLLLILICLQYMCWTPSIVGNVFHIFGLTSHSYFNAWLVFELLHFLRSVVYPLIYITMYENFSASLKALFLNASTVNKKISLQSSVSVSFAASD